MDGKAREVRATAGKDSEPLGCDPRGPSAGELPESDGCQLGQRPHQIGDNIVIYRRRTITHAGELNNELPQLCEQKEREVIWLPPVRAKNKNLESVAAMDIVCVTLSNASRKPLGESIPKRWLNSALQMLPYGMLAANCGYVQNPHLPQ